MVEFLKPPPGRGVKHDVCGCLRTLRPRIRGTLSGSDEHFLRKPLRPPAVGPVRRGIPLVSRGLAFTPWSCRKAYLARGFPPPWPASLGACSLARSPGSIDCTVSQYESSKSLVKSSKSSVMSLLLGAVPLHSLSYPVPAQRESPSIVPNKSLQWPPLFPLEDVLASCKG